MTADFDRQAAHRHFSVECFNQTWDLIDKANRTARDNEKMIGLSVTSLWHWSQRKDCTPTNISVGCWLVSRVYALIGQADNARHYGQMCLEASHGDGVAPFYLGCAYEALARAEKVAGNTTQMEEYLSKGRQVAETISDPDEKQQLLEDLKTVV